ncbi:MAG: hypothetical protein LBI95_03485 [Holosporales bacterium]|nr:hypothetical protein [Holosporales bacterium]
MVIYIKGEEVVYALFRLGRLSHVMFEFGRRRFKVLNQLFHVEHFIQMQQKRWS